jgi:hypothetical protein
MTRVSYILFAIALFCAPQTLSAQGGCSTLLEDIQSASMDEVSTDYLRLLSYHNPYCDTTDSDFQKLMIRLSEQLVAAKASKETIVAHMGEPYYMGALADYESQKVTVGRDGKASGKALPPSYKLPTGEYFVVYLWRKKDYLVFALKGGKVTEIRWWQKGDYR